MSTQLNNPAQQSGSVLAQAVPKQGGSTCEGETCRTGICSPCLIVWGVAAAWLIINALLETFQ